MTYIYLPYTVQAWKDGVCLMERNCELKLDYELPDGRCGPVDWDVTEFHFDGCGTEPGQTIYTKITRAEPWFAILYKDLDREYIDERLREALADDGLVDLYPAPPYAAL
jgi:hypothetical protein